MSVLRFIEGPT